MIADVVFDAPVDKPFSYRIPDGFSLRAGQRVVAPLGRAERTGLVVALRDTDAGAESRLRSLLRVLDPSPLLVPATLDLVRWIATQSLSSLGSTALTLLPPPAPAAG